MSNMKAKMNIKRGSLLLGCATTGNLDEAIKLLNEGADVNSRDQYEDTPLIRASYKGYLGIVVLLLDRGANIEAANDRKWTSLIAACSKGHVEIAKLLIDRGAEIEAIDSFHCTALIWTALNGQIGATELLVRRGANINVTDDSGKLPIKIAESKGFKEIVSILRARASFLSRVTAIELILKLGDKYTKSLNKYGRKR